jgi:hypothetical protein
VEQACAAALELDVVSVPKIRSIVEKGTGAQAAQAAARARQAGDAARMVTAARFARDPREFAAATGVRMRVLPGGEVRGRTPVSVIRSSRCQCTGQVGARGGCAQPLELVMILAVWWLGVRRLNERLPGVGHVPGAGVDGHGDLLAGGHGVGTVASTQSERTLGRCALRVRYRSPTTCGFLIGRMGWRGGADKPNLSASAGVVFDPVAVEAGGNPDGEMDDRLWFCCDVGGSEDEEIGGVAFAVVGKA